MEGSGNPGLPNEKIRINTVLLLMLLSCFWGGNAVAMKIGLKYMEPFILAGLRFTLAAIVIGLWSVFNRIYHIMIPNIKLFSFYSHIYQ